MKTVEINCESVGSRMAFPYKSYFSEDWTDISQGFRDRVLRPKRLNNGMFATEQRLGRTVEWKEVRFRGRSLQHPSHGTAIGHYY